MAELKDLTPLVPALGGTNRLDLGIYTLKDLIIKMNDTEYGGGGRANIFLLVNGSVVAQNSPEEIPVGSNKFFFKDFVIQVSSLNSGLNNIQYRAIEVVQGDIVNTSLSKVLSFNVVNSVLGDITIDITEGASGYNDNYPSLMPANIMVIRGSRPKDFYEATGSGRVKIQDVGGAERCIFSLDKDGYSPLNLIWVENINFTPGFLRDDSAGDTITIRKRGDASKTILAKKNVIFRSYQLASAANLVDFKEVSFNSVGIADGRTPCIISLKVQNSYTSPQVLVRPEDGLKLDKVGGINKAAFRGLQPTVEIDVVKKGVEFTVTAVTPGIYKVHLISQRNTNLIETLNIEFKALSPLSF